jgi:hypothetical protein
VWAPGWRPRCGARETWRSLTGSATTCVSTSNGTSSVTWTELNAVVLEV